MILCDPFAINTLALSTIRHLQDLVEQDTLPRVSVTAPVPDLNWSHHRTCASLLSFHRFA